MKRIQVVRKIFTDKSTIGDIFFDGEFVSNSLEDTIRHVKVMKKTAIPAGTYKLDVHFSPKFKRDMPYLLDVPFFEGIMIHWGNSDVDTDGCILTGHHDTTHPDWISSSRKSFDDLYALIAQTINNAEEIEVNVMGGLRKEEFERVKNS